MNVRVGPYKRLSAEKLMISNCGATMKLKDAYSFKEQL